MSEELIENISTLIAEWEVEGSFLCSPHDSSADRAIGRTYKKCAQELINVMKEDGFWSE